MDHTACYCRWAVLCLLVLALPSQVRADEKSPNIIVFYADDLGWTHTSLRMMKDRPDSKSDLYQTPNLERLAARGMRFSSGYAPAPVCTPSRISIQYGKTPARLHQTTVHDVMARVKNVDLSGEVSLAHVVKKANRAYRTAFFGKGISILRMKELDYDETDEADRGPNGNFHGDWVSLDNRIRLPKDDPKRVLSLTRRATKFIERQADADQPFFLMVSHYAVHVEHFSLQKTREKYLKRIAERRGIVDGIEDSERQPSAKLKSLWKTANYAALIENLDTSLGTILDELERHKILDNTYIVFTSDNGGGGGNKPLAAGKAKMFEGGLRVPTVVAGPGIEANAQCDVPVVQWDLLPTVHGMARSKAPLPKNLDGRSWMPLLEKGNAGRLQPRDPGLVFHFPWYAGQPISVIRVGDYKLMRQLNTREVKLFDVAKDLSETRDLSKELAEVTTDLERKLDLYLSTVDAWKMKDVYTARINELEGWIERQRNSIEKWKRQLSDDKLSDERRRKIQNDIQRAIKKDIPRLTENLKKARANVGTSDWQ